MKPKQGKSINETNRSVLVQGGTGKNILTILKEKNKYLDAPCNGNGSCGKCKVQLLEGGTEPTEQEKRLLTKEELADGVRLACLTIPSKDCVLLIPEDSEEILTGSRMTGFSENSCFTSSTATADLGIAIDLGTTTIAAVLVELSTGKNIAEATGVNHQRAYGADVISRIKAAVEGNGKKLQQIVQDDLIEIMNHLLAETKVEKTSVKNIAIAANTTMCHLLLGYPCDTLDKAPFEPVDILLQKRSCMEVFGTEDFQAEVTILPGISAFVGADIVAGIFACEMQEKEEYSLFLDIGTNGEMAVGNKNELFVTSTAAGPAFEGGNLSCGVASVPGAIDKVEICFPYTKVHTLKDAPAIGICGTGVIEAIYELKRNRILDENGTLVDRFLEDGYPVVEQKLYLKQQDIREFQMAKSAVRAGMERLLEWAGISKKSLKNIYVAGSFGCHIPVEKAVGIGLLPEEFKERVQPVGNTALEGARQYLLHQKHDKLDKIVSLAKEIKLATDKDFQEKFLEYLNF